MDQNVVTLKTKELASRLVAFEAASAFVAERDAAATCRVCEKLRRPLVTLTGTRGFGSLLLRALTLAKREAPALGAVKVQADGTMEGLEGEAAEAISTLVAHLLSLLITFIGETLTMRLLHDVWPDFSTAAFTLLGKETK